jgi:hypothetical protein
MPRRPITDHGTVAVYRKGCRCPQCRGAKSAHARAWRADKAAKASVLNFRPTSTSASDQLGPVQAAVSIELDGLAENRPALRAICLKLAEALDCGAGAPAATAHELARLLEVAHAAPMPHRRLAAVAKLSARRG